ncbi:hypothetical protein [Oerskovia enterophila]|uniref:hypothetical protein n=1 Tax=Oerskovia enterophila TaxID=43678 RepID=UPI003815FD65
MRDAGSSRKRLRAGGVLLGVAAVGQLVAGCSSSPAAAPTASTPGASPAEALDTYTVVRDDVLAALASLDPATPWESSGTASLSEEGSTCTLVLPAAGSAQYLYVEGDDFAAVRAALDPVLAQHGFAALGQTVFADGGAVEVSSTDDAGAELVVSSEQTSVVRLNAPVLSETCDDAELGRS